MSSEGKSLCNKGCDQYIKSNAGRLLDFVKREWKSYCKQFKYNICVW